MAKNKVAIVVATAGKINGKDARIGDTVYVDRQMANDMVAMRQAKFPSGQSAAPGYNRRDMQAREP